MPTFPDSSRVSEKRDSAKENSYIGFQDSLDAFLLAMTPSCWVFKADL